MKNFFLTIFFLTLVLFWQVIIKNQIPFNANLIASFYNPWAQEKFMGWEHGIPNKPIGKDDLWIFYPQRTFTTTVLKNWEIPFWNPYSFSGNYHLGLSETAVFYPLSFLFLILPQIDAWIILTIIEPIIAGFGMYLFLKRLVLKEKSAILGALAFAFSSIVIVRSIEGLSVGHTLIWLPYVFWGTEAFLQTKKIRFLWLMLFSLVFPLLSGWFQFTFYIFVLSFIYGLFKLKAYVKSYSKISYLIVIPFLILPLITLFHTLPAFQALLESPRVALEGRVFSNQHLMPLSHIFTLIIPDFWGNPAVYNYFGESVYKESVMFIGIIPLVLAILTIFKRKSKEELFFIGVVVVSLILAIDNPLSRLIISSPLPVFSSFLPNRIFLMTTFSLAVLAAFGLDYVLQEKTITTLKIVKKTFLFLIPTITILVLLIALPILKDPNLLKQVDATGINISTEAIRFKNSIIPTIFFLLTILIFFVFKNKYFKNAFFIAIMSILFLQSYLFAQKYIPFSNRQFLYPNHPVFDYLKKYQGFDRFMSIGLGHIVPSIPLEFNLYSPEGIGSMYIRRYGELIQYMKFGDFGIPDKIAFDLEIYPEEVFSPKNNRLNRFFELTSVKYIVTDKKSMEEEKVIPDKKLFSLAWENARPPATSPNQVVVRQGDVAGEAGYRTVPGEVGREKWQIYQYKKSMPRFFTTSNFEIIKDQEMILKSLFSESFVPNKIILEENPGFAPKVYSASFFSVAKYSPNKISFKVNSDNPTLIYFSDNYSKAFKVAIDGKEGEILRANYTFRAIPVPKGEHDVDIIYKSNSIFIGFLIAGGTLVILIVLSAIYIKIKRRDRF